MNIRFDQDDFDDAILSADEADTGPIEEWTLDEFDRFAQLRSARGPRAGRDEFDD